MKKPKVLVVATSRKTRGGITAVIRAYEAGAVWREFHCRWIETSRDGAAWRKVLYLVTALTQYVVLLPFYDIVHLHLTGGTSVRRKAIFFRLARLMGKRTIVHFHPCGPEVLDDPASARRLRRLFTGADRVVVLSGLWRMWLAERLGVRERVTVLYNPCPAVPAPAVGRQKVVLFAGSIIPRKGYDVLIQAFALVAGQHAGWCLVLAGNGEVDKARSLADGLGIGSQVDLPGWVSGEAKERLFAEASIFCLASQGEGFPMAVLDAWAHGVPCVVTPVGGLPDVVREGENALSFPVGNVHALSVQLSRLMTDPSLRERLSQASLRLAHTMFDAATIRRQLAEIYTEVWNEK